jgi:8-oxo-dGTP diphosphatase
MKVKTPKLTVDGVVVKDDSVLLIQRRNPPFQGAWALPGGFVDVGETCEAACVREVLEETGLKVRIKRLVGVYSDPKRDPRGHTVSVVFRCEVVGGKLFGGDDAAAARFFPLSSLPPLAFDHKKIVEDSIP